MSKVIRMAEQMTVNGVVGMGYDIILPNEEDAREVAMALYERDAKIKRLEVEVARLRSEKTPVQPVAKVEVSTEDIEEKLRKMAMSLLGLEDEEVDDEEESYKIEMDRLIQENLDLQGTIEDLESELDALEEERDEILNERDDLLAKLSEIETAAKPSAVCLAELFGLK